MFRWLRLMSACGFRRELVRLPYCCAAYLYKLFQGQSTLILRVAFASALFPRHVRSLDTLAATRFGSDPCLFSPPRPCCLPQPRHEISITSPLILNPHHRRGEYERRPMRGEGGGGSLADGKVAGKGYVGWDGMGPPRTVNGG